MSTNKTSKNSKFITTRLQVDNLIKSWKRCQGKVSDKAIRKASLKIQTGSLLAYFKEQLYKVGLASSSKPTTSSPIPMKFAKAFVPVHKKRPNSSVSPRSKVSAQISSVSRSLGHCPFCNSNDIDKVIATGKYKCYSCHREGFIPVITKKEKSEILSIHTQKTIKKSSSNVVRHDSMADRIVKREHVVTKEERGNFRKKMNMKSKTFVHKSIQCEICDQQYLTGYQFCDMDGWISYLCKSCASQIGGARGRKVVVYTPMGGQPR